MSEEKLTELEDKIKSLGNKRLRKLNDAFKLEEEINQVNEEYCNLSPDYVKVECPNCATSNLKGYVVNQETNKNVKCPYCQGNAFIFMKIYKE